ncbi:MAG TPA: SRPBCC family protein [Pseudonocardiaceae bacterium]|nr:SRPBCC family protein [Pseudonocardiaceae bacterium]
MYRISAQTTIRANAADVWRIVTDVNNWPSWDPHEEAARLDGEFVEGATGWSKPHGGPGTQWTITEVIEGRRWASECPLPGGKLAGGNEFTDLGDGRVRCAKTVEVYGPLVPLFRIWFGRRIRADMVRTFAALEAQAGLETRETQPSRGAQDARVIA